MQVIVSGRHQVDVDSSLREYVEKKADKLQHEYPKLNTVRFVLDSERSWQVVEGHVTGKNLTLDAKARNHDMRAAIDQAMDKLERQLRKYLERVQDHHVEKETVLQDLGAEPA